MPGLGFPRRLRRLLPKVGLGLALAAVLIDVVRFRLTTGAFGWHLSVLMIVALVVVALGFDLRRLRQPSFLAAAATLLLVNAGYFVVYLLTPLDLRWQLMFSIERLIFHTMPLGIFVAFLALGPWVRARHYRAG